MSRSTAQMKASKAVSLCWGGVQVLLMWKGLCSIWIWKSWKYSIKRMRWENSLMSARTSFQSICRGVGQNVWPLAISWVSSCERVTLLRLTTELVSSWMLWLFLLQYRVVRMLCLRLRLRWRFCGWGFVLWLAWRVVAVVSGVGDVSRSVAVSLLLVMMLVCKCKAWGEVYLPLRVLFLKRLESKVLQNLKNLKCCIFWCLCKTGGDFVIWREYSMR